jgi:hypothetical protein
MLVETELILCQSKYFTHMQGAAVKADTKVNQLFSYAEEWKIYGGTG